MTPFKPFPTSNLHPDLLRQITEKWRKFTLLRTALEGGTRAPSLPMSPHATTARLATFLAARICPDRGASVDLVEDLIWRLDLEGQRELARELFPALPELKVDSVNG